LKSPDSLKRFRSKVWCVGTLENHFPKKEAGTEQRKGGVDDFPDCQEERGASGICVKEELLWGLVRHEER